VAKGEESHLGLLKGFGFIKPDNRGPDAYVSKIELEAAQIEGVKALQRVLMRSSGTGIRSRAWHRALPSLGGPCPRRQGEVRRRPTL